MAEERIQKILARAGITSRRKAEELIQEGLVTVNGKIAQLGDKAVFGKDAIKVKGKLLVTKEAPVYLAFHKPKNIVSTLFDPEGRPSLGEYFSKVKERVYPIGRLDFGSEGLILLTNDGEFAEQIQKRTDIPRVYRVKVAGHPDAESLKKVAKGATVNGRRIHPHSVRMSEDLTSKAMIDVVMVGGGAADIKALFEMRGFRVDRMVRTAIGHLTLKELAPGQYRYLKDSQVKALLEQPELGMKRIEKEVEEAEEAAAKRKAREEKKAEWAERKARIAARQAELRNERIVARGGTVPSPIKPRGEGRGSERGERSTRAGAGAGFGGRTSAGAGFKSATKGAGPRSSASKGSFSGGKRGGFGGSRDSNSPAPTRRRILVRGKSSK